MKRSAPDETDKNEDTPKKKKQKQQKQKEAPNKPKPKQVLADPNVTNWGTMDAAAEEALLREIAKCKGSKFPAGLNLVMKRLQSGQLEVIIVNKIPEQHLVSPLVEISTLKKVPCFFLNNRSKELAKALGTGRQTIAVGIPKENQDDNTKNLVKYVFENCTAALFRPQDEPLSLKPLQIEEQRPKKPPKDNKEKGT